MQVCTRSELFCFPEMMSRFVSRQRFSALMSLNASKSVLLSLKTSVKWKMKFNITQNRLELKGFIIFVWFYHSKTQIPYGHLLKVKLTYEAVWSTWFCGTSCDGHIWRVEQADQEQLQAEQMEQLQTDLEQLQADQEQLEQTDIKRIAIGYKKDVIAKG